MSDNQAAPNDTAETLAANEALDDLVALIKDAARGGCGSHEGCRALVAKKQRDAARRWLIDYRAALAAAVPASPATNTDEAAAILSQHVVERGHPDLSVYCSCGWSGSTDDADRYQPWRAHVAAALAADTTNPTTPTNAVDPVAVVREAREAFLDSPGLNPAWIAGWHASNDHAAAHLAAALEGGE